jgi:DnaK suppressor protein
MPLTKEDLGHFRTLLERAREQANQRILAEQQYAQPPPDRDNPQDVMDLSVGDLTADTALLLSQRNSQAFNEIDLALLRMDRGEYGICEVCGTEIERRRLEVLPAARTCTDCAELREQGRRHGPTL